MLTDEQILTLKISSLYFGLTSIKICDFFLLFFIFDKIDLIMTSMYPLPTADTHELLT